MKLSNALSFVLTAAASNNVSFGSQISTSTKSGKGARLASGQDYDWAVGNYNTCIKSGVTLNGGEPVNFGGPINCGSTLTIDHLGDPDGLTFQATVVFGGRIPLRYLFEGVGSYNRLYKSQIEFYTDHTETLNETTGEWVPFSFPTETDVSVMRISELEGDTTSVVADLYENDQLRGFQFEVIATMLYTEDDSE